MIDSGEHRLWIAVMASCISEFAADEAKYGVGVKNCRRWLNGRDGSIIATFCGLTLSRDIIEAICACVERIATTGKPLTLTKQRGPPHQRAYNVF